MGLHWSSAWVVRAAHVNPSWHPPVLCGQAAAPSKRTSISFPKQSVVRPQLVSARPDIADSCSILLLMQALKQAGPAPEQCTADVLRLVIQQHLESPSILAIFPLQVGAASPWLQLAAAAAVCPCASEHGMVSGKPAVSSDCSASQASTGPGSRRASQLCVSNWAPALSL